MESHPKKKPYSAWASIAICAVAFIYFISPVDIVPDIVFGFGQLDDLAVLILAAVHGRRAWKYYSGRRAEKKAKNDVPPPIDVDGKEV